MTSLEDVASGIVSHARVVIALGLVLTLVLGAGLPGLETDTRLEQFETAAPEGDAYEYAERSFAERDENTTTVQVIWRDEGLETGGETDNALTREALLEGLYFQRDLHEDETVGPTLVEETPTVGVENVLATAIIRLEEAAVIEEEAAEFERELEAVETQIRSLEGSLEEIAAIQAEYEALNDSYQAGDIDEETYDEQASAYEKRIEAVIENATTDLESDRAADFEAAADSVRSIEHELAELAREREAGNVTDDEYEVQRNGLESARNQSITDGSSRLYLDELEALQREGERLEEARDALERIEQPPLEEQIEVLEGADQDDVDEAIEFVLGADGFGSDRAVRLLPAEYTPGETQASDRMLLITQSLDRGDSPPGALGDDVLQAQHEIEEKALEWRANTIVFGFGLVAAEVDQAVFDSVLIVGPLAILFVVGALTVAYRDPLDVVLGCVGMSVVLVWTFGTAAWASIAFTQLFVAIPVLLIGLSIDYAIHVFMRQREQYTLEAEQGTASSEHPQRAATDADSGSESTSGRAMIGALGGIAVALVLVTATTAIGFLANVVSPVGPVREFGVVSALGIVFSLVVFGAVIPAVKVEVDGFLEDRGYDRTKRAIGTGGHGRVLSSGATLARRAPVVVILCLLLVTAGGAVGTTQVDTTFDERAFLTDEPASWTSYLGPLEPGEYRMQASLAYVNEHFQREGGQAQILIAGDVTDGETMQRVARAEQRASESDAVYVLPGGDPDIQSPLSVMAATADDSESFNATFRLADRTDDDVPDQNMRGLYDGLFELNPDAASQVIYRTEGGEYEAVRLVIGTDTGLTSGETAAEMREIADAVDGATWTGSVSREPDATDSNDGVGSAGQLEVIATGEPVLTSVYERALFESIVHGLLVALVAVTVFSMGAYHRQGHGALLGIVTVVPVIGALGATLTTMAVVDIPFNVLTGMVASLTIGLGIAYSIHLSSRFAQELEAARTKAGGESNGATGGVEKPVDKALERTLRTTGGALTGSAVTTILGFGVLLAATVPLLQQFGIVTALTIGYAFLVAVLGLPTLLRIWAEKTGST
ncbi:MMPL family transporter [Halobacteria archaeon AArc-curdl1]|uniref:MMPL family transporter n=1 Tax=Natronosalvus hydrolyticus TaxID=2979988 RepID=A0AAP3E6K9_9EURY|nr:MMPL family transporter [Halobacteria archaeon AArc-curdl1]